MFIGRTGTEAEAPIIWPPDAKSWVIEKDPNAEKDWKQEKWVTEDELIQKHHPLNRHESEQTWETVGYRGAWHVTVHGVAKSLAQLSDWKATN